MVKFARIDFDAVAPLLPANKTAGLVASKGTSFDWRPGEHVVHRDTPIAFRPANAQELNCPEFVDYTGLRFGRITVMGRCSEFRNSEGYPWVIKCVCGAYETRKSPYLRKLASGNNPSHDEPMCNWCNKTRKLQYGEKLYSMGKQTNGQTTPEIP